MKNIAILVSQNMLPGNAQTRDDIFELEDQMRKITPAFAARGMTTHIVLWNDCAAAADKYDAMLPLFIWDYFETGNLPLFMEQIDAAAKKTTVLNPVNLLRWNTNKRYLTELETMGAPVIPARIVDLATPEIIETACADFGCDKLVIKPLVGGGAWRQALYTAGQPMPSADELPPAEAILQPFVPSVLTEGEYSFLYFGGQFSHAVNKRPKDGDYRIQSIYGGRELPYAPSADELAVAQEILGYMDDMPLYARVDLLRGEDGALKLIELEMVEPYLYMNFAEGEDGENAAAQMLAETLSARI